MKKGRLLMSLLGLTFALAGCNSTPEENGKAFSHDAEMREILDNMTEREVPQKTPLVERRERALITVVSLTVQQSSELLSDRIGKFLDEKVLSAEEILEAVYQCAPYSGMSRAADAAKAAEGVFKSRGISANAHRGTTDGSTADRFEKGVNAQISLFGKGFEKIKSAGKDSVPLSNYFLATNCFGDYYTRKGIDLKTRELLTMAILVNLGTEPQLLSHIKANLSQGRSKEYLEQVIYVCLPYCGYPRMLNAQRLLGEASEEAARDAAKSGLESLATAEKIFVRGEKNPFGKFFKGQSYLKRLSEKDISVANVTFEPGCRNKWHIHRAGGQLLIVTAGEGWLQFEGNPAQKLRAGDVAYIPRDIRHWHGAAKNSWFAHLSVEVPDPTAEGKVNEWLEDVSDEDYNRL
jgi:4-carboxymuconolactone decarboxylase